MTPRHRLKATLRKPGSPAKVLMPASSASAAKFAAMVAILAVNVSPAVPRSVVSMTSIASEFFLQKSWFPHTALNRLVLIPACQVLTRFRMLEDLSQNLEECRTVLRRLYPNHHVKSLLPLSRQELCNLLGQPLEMETIDVLPSPSLSTLEKPLGFEQMPTEESEWDEERRDRDPIPAEADDINALSLTMDRTTSYLGASSVKAALMVMLKVEPRLRAALASPPKAPGEKTSGGPVFCHLVKPPKENSPIAWTWKGQTFVDAYFKRLHIFTPMLDEVTFRADYLKGQRQDAPWLSLLNMVFAMGNIMATTSSDLNHVKYYNQAMEHLHLSAFGSSQIETVQALTLLGGYYLHYMNRPNMAHAILGATIRMASALGLHRESLTQKSSGVAVAETRRRTWWSLFCLDTWTTTTMGRPSFGRWGPAINIQPPKLIINEVVSGIKSCELWHSNLT